MSKSEPSSTAEYSRIAVVGAGAMGSLFGGLLAEAGLHVTLIDVWQEHVDAIRSRGLRMVGHGGDRTIAVDATTEATDAAGAEVVLFQCKGTANRQAAAAARALFERPGTVGISFQNGLGNEEMLAAELGANRIMGGLTAQGASMDGPGVVRNHAHLPTHIGEMDGTESERARGIAASFSAAGLPTHATSEIRLMIWKKLMANIGISAISGACNLTIGGVSSTPELMEMAEEAIREAAAVARAEGIQLQDEDAFSVWRQVTGPEGTATNKSSMCFDLLKSRPTEIDFINGAIAKLGLAHGMPVPVNRTLCAIVKGIERRNAGLE